METDRFYIDRNREKKSHALLTLLVMSFIMFANVVLLILKGIIYTTQKKFCITKFLPNFISTISF